MIQQPTQWSPWESAYFLGLLLLKVIGTLSFPPLGLAYLVGGLAWLAFQGVKNRPQESPVSAGFQRATDITPLTRRIPLD
jgi:hypothetical protein